MHAAIAVEYTRRPILIISGENDGVWESTRMADAVVSRLKELHFSYSYENLKIPSRRPPGGPARNRSQWHGSVRNPTSGREENLGGNAQGDAQSSLDAIPKVLEFLRESLLDNSSEK
jgi:hypothetical protein